MSSTNKTTNYNLSQFLGSDKPAWLVDYNGDMAAIDTQMKANADAASSAQTTANGADSKADINAGAISTLNTQINGEGGIATDLATVQGAVNTINSLIGNGEPTTTDKTLIGAINELDDDIDQVEGKIPPYYLANVSTGGYNQITASADGVKTYAELILEVMTAFAALVNDTYPTEHRFMIYEIIADQVGAINDKPVLFTKNNTITFDGHGSNMNSAGSAIAFMDITVSGGAVLNSFEFIMMASDSSITVKDLSSEVPASGSVILEYQEYIAK